MECKSALLIAATSFQEYYFCWPFTRTGCRVAKVNLPGQKEAVHSRVEYHLRRQSTIEFCILVFSRVVFEEGNKFVCQYLFNDINVTCNCDCHSLQTLDSCCPASFSSNRCITYLKDASTPKQPSYCDRRDLNRTEADTTVKGTEKIPPSRIQSHVTVKPSEPDVL